ncbi:GntR family transcriptional regulator [Allokutzneria albata]|uniref:DNA-binding transcriptional regulator YhcF, GntR family n=1 Tax=Allokutzneria albata TaxID=211114 RepID=A0A1G9VHB9_ALLAB|nr:GntR family transcriptional regulator [Allokutzneria albata]SDM71539.1 DNA-binding transcriptional regulator YhcF, GntR family [Allokutzneria albata]
MSLYLTIDARSSVAPYEQIRAQVLRMLASGALAPGARLPSIRQLAKDLGVASGTIARAYRELEHGGLIVSRGKHGTFVAESATVDSERVRADTEAELQVAAAAYLAAARNLGYGAEDAARVLRAVADNG